MEERIEYTPLLALKDGQNFNQIALVKESNCIKREKTFSVIVLKDRSGEIPCYITGEVTPAPGSFVLVVGKVGKDREQKLKISATNIQNAKTPLSLENFIFSLDNLTKEKLKEELFESINSITDEFYTNLIKQVLMPTDDVGQFTLYSAPLTDEKYGNYSGALLEHIVYSLRHANSVQSNYIDRNTVINPDLIKSIIILHDVGRINSFTNIMAVEKTWIARLIGIPTLTLKTIIEKAPPRETKEDSLKFAKIIHGIDVCNYLDKTPLFLEAMIAQQVQKLDALTMIYSRTLNGAKPTQLFTWENPVIKTELFNG